MKIIFRRQCWQKINSFLDAEIIFYIASISIDNLFFPIEINIFVVPNFVLETALDVDGHGSATQLK